jgi:plastocyanin
MRRRVPLTVLLTAALALALAGCGGGDEESEPAATGGGGGGAGDTTLELAADPGGALTFDQASLTAPAGKVTIELTNDSGVLHDVVVSGGSVKEASEKITEGSTSVTAEVEPGTYTFYCSVGGHREAGMEGTLTVE